MYCNKIIQDELDEVMCPFCHRQIKEQSVVVEKCWEKLSLESKDYAIVCANFGQVDGYEPMKESRSFHNNNCKIIVRSRYLRKCYLIVTTSQSRIIAIFEKINNVLPPINGHRWRMININFIMILNDMQINIDCIKIIRSKNTL